MAIVNILWDDKVTFAPHPEIDPENKVTAADMNQIKNATNNNAGQLHFPLVTDISGVIDSGSLVGLVVDQITGGGAIMDLGVHFTKGSASSIITMINGNSLIPNYTYTIHPQKA